MDTIVELVLLIASAALAFLVTSSERRGRAWSGMAATGIFLALFGGLSYGLLQLWAWLSPKLTDSFPSENDRLFTGLIVTAVLVVLALDLWGRIDILGKLRETIEKTE